MKCVFRVDSSSLIGTGHVMRCLTLANALRLHGVETSFVCRELPSNQIDFLKSKNISVEILPATINTFEDAGMTSNYLTQLNSVAWLIVDNYNLDKIWEQQVKNKVKKIMVIDDLADREHDCDLLLDQNFYTHMQQRYETLVNTECKKLLGPGYALLRPEFAALHQIAIAKRKTVERINISFGGADISNETAKAIQAVQQLNKPNLIVDVVVGASNPHKEKLAQIAKALGFNFYFQIDNMAELFSQADLAIGAGGTTIWERSCLGLPSLVIAIADNQEQVAEEADKQGLHQYLGKSTEVSVIQLTKAINEISNDETRWLNMRTKALNLVDGLGSQRVIEQMLN